MTIRLTLIGGPTMLIEIGGLRIVTDPTFDAPQSYEGGVVLTKQTGPAIEAQQVLPVDVVLLSHDQHFDNLDHSGRALLPQAGRVLTTMAGADRLRDNVPKVEGLAPWQSVAMPTIPTATTRSGRSSAASIAARAAARPLKITATPARHGPRGFEPISGDVVGFLLTIGERTIYVSGDTVWYDGIADIAQRHDVDVAILFTGAARPRGAFHVTMDSNDAIEAAHAFGEATIVAIHNEGWGHFSETQSDVAGLFEVLGLSSRLRVIERGVPLVLELA
jgi:L-ascorbate metabolism protein UlaG (beta-lactamase superfamily)